MNSKIKSLFTVLVTLVVLSVGLNLFLGYKVLNFSTVEVGTKEKITIEVIVDTPNQEKSYHQYVLVGSEAEFLKQAMDEVGMEFVLNEYGFTSSINGLEAVWEDAGRQEYWAIYINNEYGQFGVNEQTISDGMVIKFVFTDTKAVQE